MSGVTMSLSDDELDALMDELVEVAPPSLLAAEPEPEPESPVATGEPQPFQLGQSAAHPTIHLPGLERIGQKLARGLREVVEPFSRARTQVSPATLETRPYDEWKADLPYHVAVSHYRVPSVQGGFLVVVEPDFIAGLVESFYGGNGGGRPPKTGDFTASEERLLAKLVDQVVMLMVETWAPSLPMTPVLAARDLTATHINLVRADDMVVLQPFTVLPGAARASTITIVYPLSMLRPIEDQIVTRAHDHAPAADDDWRVRMAEALEAVTVPVRSVLARPAITLGQLMNLKPGDVIPIQLAPHAPLLAGARQLGLGTLGEQDGRAALMIQHMGPQR